MDLNNLLQKPKGNTIELLWNEAKENGVKLDYQFTKKDYRVPSEVREDICGITQLDGIAKIELRPTEDNCCVSFKVERDKNKARELVGVLCSMAEVWRCHSQIIISLVPKRLYYRTSANQR